MGIKFRIKFLFELRCHLLRTLYGHLLQALRIESIKIKPEKLKQLSKYVLHLCEIIIVVQLSI